MYRGGKEAGLKEAGFKEAPRKEKWTAVVKWSAVEGPTGAGDPTEELQKLQYKDLQTEQQKLKE